MVGGDAQVDGGVAAGDEPVGLGELGGGGGEADLESFSFPGPAFAFGFGDAGGEVGVDVLEPGPLVWVDPQQRAPDAAVLVDAAGAVDASAVAEGDPASFEVAEELVPFLVRRGAVFLVRAIRSQMLIEATSMVPW